MNLLVCTLYLPLSALRERGLVGWGLKLSFDRFETSDNLVI